MSEGLSLGDDLGILIYLLIIWLVLTLTATVSLSTTQIAYGVIDRRLINEASKGAKIIKGLR